MSSNAVFIRHPESALYKFGEEHPFNPIRLTLAGELLQSANALQEEAIVIPAYTADHSLLTLVHRPDYVDIVEKLSEDHPSPDDIGAAAKYGLDTEDTPFFPGIHTAAAAIVAGSVEAADQVMSGKALHAYHMAGGLHHAFPDRGAGFCVYNDAAVAIRHLRQTYNARVLYIDTDVHHGDGVQWVFYDDPQVCTYSIHETGKFLFPGTGFVHEKGTDAGFGTCFNVPVEPYTEDDSWLESFRESVEKVAAAFKPDIIISQHGCDAHAYDPLSHIHCSMRIYKEMPAIIHELAHRYAGGRWAALGGGGYDIWRVVPRAWSLVWLAMTDHPIAAALEEEGSNAPLPQQWLDRWKPLSPEELPEWWLDDWSEVPPIPRREEITNKNRAVRLIAVQDLT
ncbi:acetoin utilization protein AcuC [Paenibacillus gorillae]|uniref:acetoin utilization protein AcuC n=1 Tax=Paenibacillus gorillae TaxID=1243662 RepID=UPI0004B89AC8|nr:acetoin utilization protein AcuC [Paenibacillus gorillae]